VLVLHVDFALVFWLLASAAALWSFEIGLRSVRAPVLGTACAALALVAPLSGGRPILGNYIPVIDTPLYLAALAGFALALALLIAQALRHLPRLPRGTAPGDTVRVQVRDKSLAARVVKIPFVRNGKSLINPEKEAP